MEDDSDNIEEGEVLIGENGNENGTGIQGKDQIFKKFIENQMGKLKEGNGEGQEKEPENGGTEKNDLGGSRFVKARKLVARKMFRLKFY